MNYQRQPKKRPVTTIFKERPNSIDIRKDEGTTKMTESKPKQLQSKHPDMLEPEDYMRVATVNNGRYVKLTAHVEWGDGEITETSLYYDVAGATTLAASILDAVRPGTSVISAVTAIDDRLRYPEPPTPDDEIPEIKTYGQQ